MLGSRERRAERMAESYRNQAVRDCHAAENGQQLMEGTISDPKQLHLKG